MSSSRRLFPEQRDEDDEEEEEEETVNTNDALVKAAAAATTRVIILLRSFGIYLFFVVCTQNLSYFIEEKNTMQSDPARASLSLSLSLSLWTAGNALERGVSTVDVVPVSTVVAAEGERHRRELESGTVLRGVERPRGVDSRRVSIEMVDRKSAKTMAGTRGKRSRKTKTGRRRRGRGGGTRGRVLSVRRLVLAVRDAGDAFRIGEFDRGKRVHRKRRREYRRRRGGARAKKVEKRVRVFGGRREGEHWIRGGAASNFDEERERTGEELAFVGE